MSLANALQLIARVRDDPRVRERLRGTSLTLGLEAGPLVGAELGLDCSTAELRQAFAIDWAMRAFHDGRRLSASLEANGKRL